jgi:endonuclease G
MSDEFRTVIPVEIIVRVGAAGAASVSTTAAVGLSAAPKVLTRGPEAVKIDTDYSNRTGYDPRFIPNTNVPLPKPKGALAQQVAPLRHDEPNFAEGELTYEHFSIKMHRSKRIAIFTATNIDGTSYLNVDRDTGQVISIAAT